MEGVAKSPYSVSLQILLLNYVWISNLLLNVLFDFMCGQLKSTIRTFLGLVPVVLKIFRTVLVLSNIMNMNRYSDVTSVSDAKGGL